MTRCRAALDSLARLLFPPRCALCGEPVCYPDGNRPGGEIDDQLGDQRGDQWTVPDICAGCLGDLPRIADACRRCAEPVSAGSLCIACRRYPPPMDLTLAPLHYAFPADWLLTELKFNARLWHGPLLAGIVAAALEAQPAFCPGPAAVLIPVPLHRRRLAARGYNQALEIARPLARRLGCRLAGDLVVRIRPTREQSSLSARARRRNVAGAFRLQRPADFGHAVIVDDVVTTGATTREIAALLRDGGCARVSVVAAARALSGTGNPARCR